MRKLDAGGVAGRLVGIQHEALAVLELDRAFGERAERAASGPADRPGCRSGGHSCSRHCGWSLTSSRILSCEVWLILMRNTSAPASNSLRIIALSEEAGPSVARILMRRRRLISCVPGAGGRPDPPGGDPPAHSACPEGRRVRPGRPFPEFPAPAAQAFVGFGQLHGPGALFAGIDLEEAGAVEAARQAILGALDGEFLVARAHEGLSRPLAAAVVIERIDIIKPCDKRAAQQGFAAPRGDVPPAFGGPALGVLVAERDADPARGVVAKTEIRRRRSWSTGTSPQTPAPAAGRRSGEQRAGCGDGILCGHSVKLYQFLDDFA